jgi:hypothetical protein
LKVKYIEYLLKGGNTANVLLFNCRGGAFLDNNDKFITYLVDGKQRFNALSEFKNNKIKVFKEYCNDKIGFGFNDLEPKFFSQSNMNLKILINGLETELEELQWYYELNQGNVSHSKEELDFVLERINFLKNN